MRLTNRHAGFPSDAAGFTLLEVLLTLVILAIGLLGLAAMQVVGLKSGSTASYRGIATLVAGEMADRMRANKGALGTITVDQITGKITTTESLFKSVTSASADAKCDTLPNDICSSWLDGVTLVAADDCDTAAKMAAYDINVMYCGNPLSSSDPKKRTAFGLAMLPEGSMTIACSSNPCVPGSEHTITLGWKERPEGADKTATAIARSLTIAITPMRDDILPTE